MDKSKELLGTVLTEMEMQNIEGGAGFSATLSYTYNYILSKMGYSCSIDTGNFYSKPIQGAGTCTRR